MEPVITIPAFGDNFIYLYRYDQTNVFAVDSSDASAVLDILKKRGLNLTEIFATHHHWDHIGANSELKKAAGCKVIGPDKQRIPGIDRVVEDGEVVTIGNTKVEVIATPGHTRTSVCYYIRSASNNVSGILWTGDTLFAGGCGRVFECDAETMLHSLLRLAALPDETRVCCGHNYTLENYEFALNIEPDNQTLKERLEQIREAQSRGGQAAHSTILQERTTNPFLRCDTAEMKSALNMSGASAVEVFAELRRRKDIF